VASPFDNDEASFVVLINDEGEHSLWPDSKAVPAGWRITFGADSRRNCLEFVDRNWVDLRPASLIAHSKSGGHSHF
jgi:MbtH protein